MIMTLLLLLILSSCASTPEKVQRGDTIKFQIYLDKVEFNLLGLSKQEDRLAEALAARAPENELYANAWNEKVKTYKASCAYYRKIMLADAETTKISVHNGLITAQQGQRLIAESVKRNLQPYLKSMMIHGIDVGLTRTFIEVQFVLLQEIVKMELGEAEFDLEEMK